MSSPNIPQGENLYIPRKMEILSAIQDASMKATLPIIFAIFKHLSNYIEGVDRNKIKKEIIEDKDLKSSISGSRIMVDEVSLDNSIEVLSLQGIFLELRNDNKIGLTEKGIEAAELLGLGPE